MRFKIRHFLVIAFLCCARSLPAASCEPGLQAAVPLAVVDRAFLLTLEVNGVPATFQLDTGAEHSLVTPSAVRRLGLALDKWVGASVQGVGGIERHSMADPRSFSLAGQALHHDNTARDARLIVAQLGPGEPHAAIDGLLGRDFLSQFGVELDGPQARLRLWNVRGCSGSSPSWRDPFATITAIRAYGNALVFPVQANGVALRALPDSGASETLLAAPGMARLGLAATGNGGAFARGVGPFVRPLWPLRLATLRIGDDVDRDVPVLGSQLRILPIVDLVLGADWFRAHDVWLSYKTGQVFVRSAVGRQP